MRQITSSSINTYSLFLFLRSLCDGLLAFCASQSRAVSFESILKGTTPTSKATEERRHQSSVASLFVRLPWHLKKTVARKDRQNWSSAMIAIGDYYTEGQSGSREPIPGRCLPLQSARSGQLFEDRLSSIPFAFGNCRITIEAPAR